MVLTKRKTQEELQQTLDYVLENLPRKCKRCRNKAKLIRDECLRLHRTWKVCNCWKGYINVKSISFEYKTVSQSKRFVNLLDGTHTNTIEGYWYTIKAQVPVRNRTNSRINLYLLRFMILKMSQGMHSLIY